MVLILMILMRILTIDSNHSSDSELLVESEEVDSEMESIRSAFSYGRDRYKWTKAEIQRNVRTPADKLYYCQRWKVLQCLEQHFSSFLPLRNPWNSFYVSGNPCIKIEIACTINHYTQTTIIEEPLTIFCWTLGLWGTPVIELVGILLVTLRVDCSENSEMARPNDKTAVVSELLKCFKTHSRRTQLEQMEPLMRCSFLLEDGIKVVSTCLRSLLNMNSNYKL